MVGLVIVELVVLIGFISLVRLSLKYANPYKLYFGMGNKGAGKTTLMYRLSRMYIRKGWGVYSNSDIPGGYKFDIREFGKFYIPPHSLILLDEVDLYWDNRDFKNFPKELKEYLKFQRKYKHVVWMFSQSFSVDLKIRNLTDGIYLIQNVFNIFSVAQRVRKTITIVHADKSAQGESKIVDDYAIDPWWKAPFGGTYITFIPRYSKYYNSFDPPYLPEYNFESVPDVPKNPNALQALAAAVKDFKEQRRSFVKLLNSRKDNPDHYSPAPDHFGVFFDDWFELLDSDFHGRKYIDDFYELCLFVCRWGSFEPEYYCDAYTFDQFYVDVVDDV